MVASPRAVDLEQAAAALERLSSRRVLIIDIETSQHHAKVWGFRKQFIAPSQVFRHGQVICWAAKWWHDRSTLFRSDFHDGHDVVVADARALLDEADVVVGWYSSGFDIKYLQSEVWLAGLPRPKPHRDVDLYRVVRKQFLFPSYSLNYVAGRLGVGTKLRHPGQEMWDGCEADDPKAWSLMKRYNRQDVALTEKVLDRVAPWVPNFPHQGLYGGPRAGCPVCQSMQIVQEGYTVAQTGRYALWRCRDCTALFRGTHRVEAVHHRTV